MIYLGALGTYWNEYGNHKAFQVCSNLKLWNTKKLDGHLEKVID